MSFEVFHHSNYVDEFGSQLLDMPFHKRRNFAYGDCDERFFVIDSTFDSVVEVLQDLSSLHNHDRDIYGKVINAPRGFLLIYEMVVNQRIIVVPDYADNWAKFPFWKLSEELNGATVRWFEYDSEEDAGHSYYVYENGKMTECFSFAIDKLENYENYEYSEELFNRIGNSKRSRYFLLINKKTGISTLMTDPPIIPFMEAKLLELNVYAPAIVVQESSSNENPNEFEFTFRNLNLEAFKRIDCIY
ncbi:MAG: hypothetical protein ACFB14_28140 [Leptolyngbyaceae cyanobacterium]|mgnify:CR=1 FL=1